MEDIDGGLHPAVDEQSLDEDEDDELLKVTPLTAWNALWLSVHLVSGLFVGCLTSQKHAGVSQGRICSDSCACCHTETEVSDQTFYLTRSQYTDTGPASPSADPITPGAWQGSHWSSNFKSLV